MRGDGRFSQGWSHIDSTIPAPLSMSELTAEYWNSYAI